MQQHSCPGRLREVAGVTARIAVPQMHAGSVRWQQLEVKVTFQPEEEIERRGRRR